MKWVVGRNGDVVEVPYNQTVCEVPLLKVADKELNKHAEKLIQKAAEHSSNRIWANERFVKISGVKYAIAPADDLGIFCDGGKLGKGLIITNTSAVRKVAL
jgi:ferritin-like protein